MKSRRDGGWEICIFHRVKSKESAGKDTRKKAERQQAGLGFANLEEYFWTACLHRACLRVTCLHINCCVIPLSEEGLKRSEANRAHFMADLIFTESDLRASFLQQLN